MLKEVITCPKCKATTCEYFCDECGKNLSKIFKGLPILIQFGYGHNLDGVEVHFCSTKCALNYLADEQKKEIRNIIFG